MSRALLLFAVAAVACGPSSVSPARCPLLGRAPRPWSGPTPEGHVCPLGTTSVVEQHDRDGTLFSCIVPERGGSTPFRQGPYTKVRPDGSVITRGAYRNNREHGAWREWDSNGQLRREIIYDNGAARSDSSWDAHGQLLERRGASAVTTWYPTGQQKTDSHATADGGRESTTWHLNGNMATFERTVNGVRDGASRAWFESGQPKLEARYRAGVLVAWEGWSSNGRPLTSDSCVDDADCVSGVRNECFRCVPPYEAITRWQEAQRLLHPPPAPTGCDRGPFPCTPPRPPPGAACRESRCVLSGLE